MPFSEAPSQALPSVSRLDRQAETRIWQAINAKAKPPGSLGRVEALAVQIALIAGSDKPRLGKAAAVLFAGDHGLVAEGVAAYPADVSGLIAQMALDGVAGANIAARAVGAEVVVVDSGLTSAIAPHPRLMEKRVASGTRNARFQAAMTDAQAAAALWAGREVAIQFKADGFGILALGEIGIGNSSAAALIAHAVTQLPLENLTGTGAGAPPLGLAHKLDVLKETSARAPVTTGFDAMREFGGFEMAMLTGAMIGGAFAGAVVLVDGFIATACACAAISIEPDLREYLVFAHLSPERGHAALLEWLGAKPLLDLGMRLGEGTGAILAIPLVRMAEALLCDMADLP